ncbi:hypothetical protein FOA52_006405 [Chlamydomonas sp. UWO 241]|nr:hypothetical protein FOA52_006405 [Chlamydomonas sp. UWO 241]
MSFALASTSSSRAACRVCAPSHASVLTRNAPRMSPPSASFPSCSRRSVRVRAEASDDAKEPVLQAKAAVTSLFQHYDFLSTGVGALIVTGFFWANGQDPIHALSITATSTVIGVVANELLFNDSA